ncbi:MAG: MarR family transcriptional regulator [Chloroflexi bacterium]|nr:MarR family transcriptional regulator [Chloroflexota bacterium]
MDNQQQFVEDCGLYFEKIGLTRMAGRIIGWLLICDPPQQTMTDIVDALQASKSSISTSLRMLEQASLIQRFTRPGERRDYYRLAPDLWIWSFKARMHLVTELRELAEHGLTLLADEPPDQRRRLELMRDVNGYLEREFPKLLDGWQQEKKAKGYGE